MQRFPAMRLLTLALAFSAGMGAQRPDANESTVVPRLIRFTGIYRSFGQAEPGVAGITFSIYREQYDGTPLWSEIQNVQPDKDGNYSVLLGSTRSEGLPIELFTTAEQRWLEVEADQMKQKRVLLTSVPYAMKAADAETLGGLPASAYLRAGSPQSGAVLNSSAGSSLVPAAGVTPSANNGTPNFIGMFSNTTDLIDSAIFQSGNAVSVGGTTSLGAMTLIGNVPFGDAAGMALYNVGGGNGASVSLDMYNTSSNSGVPQAKIKAIDDGNYSDHLTFWTKTPGGPGNAVGERARITSSGNVGIGTQNPSQKLEVAGSVKISGLGNQLIFPDGSVQTKAESVGPQGPQGVQGPQGPQGVQGVQGATGPAAVTHANFTQGGINSTLVVDPPNVYITFGSEATITIPAGGGTVLATSTAAIGTSVAATSTLTTTLQLAICVQSPGAAIQAVNGAFVDINAVQWARTAQSISIILTNLTPGTTYKIGACYSTESPNWNNNDFVFNSAVTL